MALKAVRKGGREVCAGIHMSDIPSFQYNILWEERQIVSVVNLKRQDGLDFLEAAAEVGIKTTPRLILYNRLIKLWLT
jgi:alcohol dehydrogenase, propanol-preferring